MGERDRDPVWEFVDAYPSSSGRVPLSEPRSFIAQCEATAGEAVFDDTPEPTKVTEEPTGPRHRVRRRGRG